MTIEEGMAKVAREIDALLVTRMDDYVVRMIASGLEADEVADIVEEQRQREAVWRVATLNDLRQKLVQPW